MNRFPRRMCLVVDNLPPSYSGAGQQAVTLAVALKRRGVDVVLVGKAHGQLPLKGVLNGIDTFRVRLSGIRMPVMARLHEAWRLLALLLRLRDRYALIVFFDPEGGFQHAWMTFPILHALRKATVARMTLMQASDPRTLHARRFGAVRVMPYRLHHRTVSISTALTHSYHDVFGDDGKLVSIPNGVDTERFTPVAGGARHELRASLGLLPQASYGCFLGRMSVRKGIDTIIAAWASVVAHVPHAVLLLVGPTEDRYRNVREDAFVAEAKQTIARLGLERHVVWVGPTDCAERYLQASDVFVFASRREGCPNAILEAMACGLPVVAAAIEGVTTDLIESGVDGVVVDNTAAAIAGAVVDLLTHDIERAEIGRRARERVLARHSVEVSAARYEHLLKVMAA